MTIKIAKGMVLFAIGAADEDAIAEARAYIQREGYSKENVKILRSDDKKMIVVEATRHMKKTEGEPPKCY